MKIDLRHLLITLSAIVALTAQADVPPTFNYQGYLTAASGAAVNDTLPISVTYWNDATSTSQDSFLYAESFSATTIEQGLFSIALGSGDPLMAGDEFDPGILGDTVWLQINVGGEDLTPRRALSSAAYSLRSQTAETVASNSITTNQVVDNSITGNDIEDESITSGDVANGTLRSVDVAPSSRPETRVSLLGVTIQQSAPRIMNEVTLSPGEEGIAIVHAHSTATLSEGQGIRCWITQDDLSFSANDVRAKAPTGSGMTVPLALTGRIFGFPGLDVKIQHFCQITDGPLFLPVSNSRMTVVFMPGATQ